MGRPTTPLSANPVPSMSPGSAQQVLDAWARVQAPLCRLLLRAGLDYPRAAAELKQVFLEQAHAQLQDSNAADTDSALSLLSGVHRKDIRQWRGGAQQQPSHPAIGPGAQLLARWAALPGYRDRQHRPKAIRRVGPAPSFEHLARQVTQDVHAFTLLQELTRMGLVRTALRRGVEYVEPQLDAFVPSADLAGLLELLGMNLADHAAAAVCNVHGETPRLEQSVFADGLSDASMQRLAELARELWARSREAMIAEALRCVEADREARDARGRMRFGAYYWNSVAGAAAAAPATRQRRAATRQTSSSKERS